jgi:hypothetical protein
LGGQELIGGDRSTQVDAISVPTRKDSAPLTDHPTIEARPMRGLWVGLLIAVPFWLFMAMLWLILL